jgi:hypothetical protein
MEHVAKMLEGEPGMEKGQSRNNVALWEYWEAADRVKTED